MTDVAYYYIDELQALGDIPPSLQNYIDYEAYGRDLDMGGICLCDIGLGVWSDVWQGLLVMEVWLELERGLWQVLFYLLIQKISETVPTHSHSVTILLWEVRQAQRWGCLRYEK